MKESIDFLSTDRILKAVIDTYGIPSIPKREQGFAALCHIILEQQVSIASAKATYKKLENELGQLTPKVVLETPDEVFRACGVSRQKTTYIKDLAQRVTSGSLDFESFKTKSPEEITTELLAVKGVGNWSVEVYLMFCMQHEDVLPIGDIAIRSAIKELYDIHDPEEMRILGENWKPYRSMASFILWYHYLSKRKRKDHL
ncbi:DNA-3-methyladenine glycosylase family protein [Flavobacterium silvaticum]|uniref:DNA-3-methyladenine glycosylase II n=1 Tax=Flavobacterium silvaticum TaxID=1852020 RepID=A0A972JHK2_9FLAO|nr:DNA-3-methyladenine glycosylase 2 family protein [Flavobacterium silvaticum]NMH27223.1 DNA-3-methyladenine glycosylase 2 family protein [Flavobacterium silvaticum]